MKVAFHNYIKIKFNLAKYFNDLLKFCNLDWHKPLSMTKTIPVNVGCKMFLEFQGPYQ